MTNRNHDQRKEVPNSGVTGITMSSPRQYMMSARASKKLDYKRIGPYTVSKVINHNAYKLDLPPTMRVHNVFHVSLLDRYRDSIPGQPLAELTPIVIGDNEEWEVDRILNSRYRHRRLQYLVQWAGYSHLRTSWEPADNLENASELVEEFHHENLTRPKLKMRAEDLYWATLSRAKRMIKR